MSMVTGQTLRYEVGELVTYAYDHERGLDQVMGRPGHLP